MCKINTESAVTINLICIEDVFLYRIKYVVDFLTNHPSSPKNIIFHLNNNSNISNALNIHYYSAAPKDIKQNDYIIIPQHQLFCEKATHNDHYDIKKYTFGDMQLYSIEKPLSTKSSITSTSRFIVNNVFSFDIIETIFFFISRYEEWYCPIEKKDHHNRMKSSEQLLVKNNIHKIPVVDHLVFAFFSALNLPLEKQKTTYAITHDIDALRKFPSLYKLARATARIIKKKQGIKKLRRLYYYYLKTKLTKFKDPYDTIDWLLKENKAELKIIYFMSGGKTVYDNLYKINEKSSIAAINLAKNCKYLIGLHPSYATYNDENQYQKELLKLKSVVFEDITHNRQHILHFSFEDTIKILENFKIKIDSTLCYQDNIGFRCGTGFSYYLYDFENEKPFKIKELPLVIMDGPLLMEGDYDVEKAKNILYNFLMNNLYLTNITFNFHNTIFDDTILNAEKLRTLYKLLNLFIEKVQKDVKSNSVEILNSIFHN